MNQNADYSGIAAGGRGPWIETASGGKFYLLDPRPEEVRATDIAHALASQCRWTGHCREFYSVAQHSFLVSFCCDEPDALAGLLHDAAEAYTGDKSRPLKEAIPEIREVEERIRVAIFRAFGLPEEVPASVKQADLRLLLAEKRDLMTALEWEAPPPAGITPWPEDKNPLAPWGVWWAQRRFMLRLAELYPRVKWP